VAQGDRLQKRAAHRALTPDAPQTTRCIVIKRKPSSSKEGGELIDFQLRREAFDPLAAAFPELGRDDRRELADQLKENQRDETRRQEAIARRGSEAPTDHDLTQWQAAFVRDGRPEAAQIIQGLGLALFGADKTLLSKVAEAVNALIIPKQSDATLDAAMKVAQEQGHEAVALVEDARRRAKRGGRSLGAMQRLCASLCEGRLNLEKDGLQAVVDDALRAIWAWSGGKLTANNIEVIEACRKKRDLDSVILECFRKCGVPTVTVNNLRKGKTVAGVRLQRAKRKK
jgi:hypothetical protein